MTRRKLILGIETSCDDTSIAILRENGEKVEILAHQSFSQELLLRKWGGVVPEIAARNHMYKLGPLLNEVLTLSQIKLEEIDGVAVTTHPGLLGPLLTGLNTAKSICLIYEKSLIPVNHLYAHLEAIHITEKISYPYLGILVSGGHSSFFKVNSPTEFKLLGTTTDDAAGEAFDKGGKLMGLSYPAGKEIDDLAKLGDPHKHLFPIGLANSKDANLSYSGVKTSLRTFLEKNPELVCSYKDLASKNRQEVYDLCASYQHAIVQALVTKLPYAIERAKESNLPIVVGGGVACNSYLRAILTKNFSNVSFVKPSFCTDNGAMIANYALRTFDTNQVPFPNCLELDARNRFISKPGAK